ncbi:hypothetical protein AVEN_188539-1 [Araneus ventricosus]|uniref:Uncharacterized protein n=1 Tax=Araneus ventricosus TaxID=182803 RepID=A0A4Y2SBK9_ARAVE|nr:hypothetical protein AVEN_188539-1 [Araneus ventricosus]
MGRHARPTRGGNLLSVRSKKQTERQLLLMESSLAYPGGKEKKAETQKEGKNSKGDQTLGYLGVVKPVTPKEDVPLRGLKVQTRIVVVLILILLLFLPFKNEDTDSEDSESLYKDAESSDEDGGGSHPHPTPVTGSPSWKENYDWLGENSDEDDGGSPHPTYVAAVAASPHCSFSGYLSFFDDEINSERKALTLHSEAKRRETETFSPQQHSEGGGDEEKLEQPIEVRRSDVSPSTRTKLDISEALEYADDVTSSTGATRLREEQRSCPSLKEAFLQCNAKKGNYSFINGLLHHMDKILGQPVTQLVLRQSRRQQV